MKASQRSLANWTKQKWRTKSGKPSTQGRKETGERYLPSKQLEQVNNFLNSPKRLLKKRQDLDEKRKVISAISETISKDRKLSNEQTRKSTKKKTRKRR